MANFAGRILSRLNAKKWQRKDLKWQKVANDFSVCFCLTVKPDFKKFNWENTLSTHRNLNKPCVAPILCFSQFLLILSKSETLCRPHGKSSNPDLRKTGNNGHQDLCYSPGFIRKPKDAVRVEVWICKDIIQPMKNNSPSFANGTQKKSHTRT